MSLGKHRIILQAGDWWVYKTLQLHITPLPSPIFHLPSTYHHSIFHSSLSLYHSLYSSTPLFFLIRLQQPPSCLTCLTRCSLIHEPTTAGSVIHPGLSSLPFLGTSNTAAVWKETAFALSPSNVLNMASTATASRTDTHSSVSRARLDFLRSRISFTTRNTLLLVLICWIGWSAWVPCASSTSSTTIALDTMGWVIERAGLGESAMGYGLWLWRSSTWWKWWEGLAFALCYGVWWDDLLSFWNANIFYLQCYTYYW